MGIVDLHFKALVGKSLFLKSGMEIDTGIGTRFGHDQCLEFEICKVMIHHRTVIVKMGADACNLDAAVFNGEGTVIFTGLPSVEGLAVEEANPSSVLFQRSGTGAGNDAATTRKGVPCLCSGKNRLELHRRHLN